MMVRRWLSIAVVFSLCLLPEVALAQTLSLDMGEGGGSATQRIIQLFLLFTALSVAPSIVLMITCFTRLLIVFSLLKQALGTQNAPPPMVLTSLALFMSLAIMGPALERAWTEGISPYVDERIDEDTAFERTMQPFREFMLANVREKDLALFANMAEGGLVEGPNVDAEEQVPLGETEDEIHSIADTLPLRAIVPAFMLSEIRRGFEIGFLVYVPFVIIDMVIASVLMSMGMMMLPPMMIALPFKIVFFVLVDGWYLVVGSLVRSFNV